MADIKDVCIVGAGLSGAYAARTLLANGKTVSLLDGRDRIGGRLLTAEEERGPGAGDLGGAWIWPRSEYVMKRFVDDYGIRTATMHLEGETVARTTDGRRHVLPDGAASQYAACGGGAVRIHGGAASMVQKLLQGDNDDDVDNPDLSIELGMRVVRIEHGEDVVKISCTNTKSKEDECETKLIECRRAILAAPPKVLANTIEFDPPLPKKKMDAMLSTPTWMEDYGKVSVSFPQNWWRRRNFSAISIDQMGAVSTWWEACSGDDGDGALPTLAGFVTRNGAKTLNEKMGSNEAALHDYALDALKDLYGVDVTAMGIQKDATDVTIQGSADTDGVVISKGGITVTYKSWLEDPFTNGLDEQSTIAFPRQYGDRYLQQSVGPLFFAGTEAAHGSGHMEGAVVAAQRAAGEVMQYLS